MTPNTPKDNVELDESKVIKRIAFEFDERERYVDEPRNGQVEILFSDQTAVQKYCLLPDLEATLAMLINKKIHDVVSKQVAKAEKELIHRTLLLPSYTFQPVGGISNIKYIRAIDIKELESKINE